jgi:hypothetical protein
MRIVSGRWQIYTLHSCNFTDQVHLYPSTDCLRGVGRFIPCCFFLPSVEDDERDVRSVVQVIDYVMLGER